MDTLSHLEEVGPMGRPDVVGSSDRTALVSELFQAHHRRLVGLAWLLVHDQGTAEEVVQDAFLTLYRRWRVLRDPSAAVAYLNRCVVNGGRKHLRQGLRLRALTPRMVPQAPLVDSAEEDAVVHDQLDRMRREIRVLPQRQREVVVLRYYLDLSEAEIADLLGVSRGSVKSHASRGLATLARRLEAQS